MVSILTLVNASGERKNAANVKPQMTPNVCQCSAELRPNSHMLLSEQSQTLASVELRPICNGEICCCVFFTFYKTITM